MTTPPESLTAPQDRPCGLMRRLIIMLYDSLPATAIVFLAALAVLPLTGDQVLFGRNIAYTVYVLAMIFLYLGICWVYIGQTLGMRAWKVELVTLDGQRPGWRAAGLRYLSSMLSVAALGMGFWSCLLREDRASWHDRISGTRLRRCG